MPSIFGGSKEVSSALRRFYFSLDALLSSVIHPKYMDDTLVSKLGLTVGDIEFSSRIDEFFGSCQGRFGAPLTVEKSRRVLGTVHDLMRVVPASQVD